MCGPEPKSDPMEGLSQQVELARETVALLARDVEALTAAIEKATRVAIAGSG